MDPETLTPTNPLYEKIKNASQLLNKEMLFIYYSGKKSSNNNNTDKENEELEPEMLFLRSTLEYFYQTGVLPHAIPEAAADFAATRLFAPLDEFIRDNYKYRERFKKRVFKIGEKLEPLETIREQDAFELGIRIWGTLSSEFVKRRHELVQKENGESIENFPPSLSSSSPDESDDAEEFMCGVYKKYPSLARAVSGYGAKIPQVLKEFVDMGAENLGEERVNEMDEQWKAEQLEKLKRFIVKTSAMRLLASDLMDELQNSLDS